MSNPKQPWLIRYSYDPLDKLTSQSLSDTPERHRFCCKNRLATEIQGAIGHSIVQHGDFLLAQRQYENNALDTTLLATDVQRSVLHTLKKDGERQASAYSPYGHRTALSGLLSLLGFNGERPDPETGHYLLGNGYRAFNPVLMRFNSPDSLSPFGKGGLNSYSYCLGDPVNLSDPNGHVPTLAEMAQAVIKKTSNIGNTIKPTLSAANEIITPAFTASNTVILTPTGLFESLKRAPHLLENIVQRLPGSDMTALARTSSGMKDIVYHSARKLPNKLHEVSLVTQTAGANGYSITGGTGASIVYIREHNIQRIGGGMALGILPVQIPRAGIKVRFLGEVIDDDFGFGLGLRRFTEAEQSKIFTLRALT
ncbi:RHS repeat-associated core domain-containing protein [Pseudomonas sp. WJP1]|uniref:RHS repeat-associated core domain-containing protein n=1 Tax=Pseudomonas sp. WJP1 TaxID=2986947 RepID=UPI00234A5BE1|nr:RHS repeat-associated core domain-containing protein [Pseudomonas sp. WJP1]WCM48728.1 RHS repeat-associated core domain-containing protein [Pseudomonas sp. WJP1]